MEWAFAFNEKLGIMEVDVSGEMTREELNAMAKANLDEVKKRNCFRCLLDYRKVSRNLGILDMYDRPKDLSDVGVSRVYRIAIQVEPAAFPNYAFMENVYKNNGYELRVFTDRDSAIGYLTQD